MEKIKDINIEDLISLTRRLEVLYVEDQYQTQEETKKMLYNFFGKITTASNGKEGLAKFKDEVFDIVITDLDMPIMSGIEMIEKIREFDIKTPILVISVYNDSEFILETVNQGIDGYVLKPFSLVQITSAIKKIAIKLDMDLKKRNIVKLAYDYIWDKEKEALYKNSEVIPLTKTEVKLFKVFIKNENIFLNPNILYHDVYDDGDYNEAKLRNVISRLKSKLNPHLIETNYNFGYLLKKA